jgi:hypothetical protein
MAEIFVDMALVEVDGVETRTIKSITADVNDTKAPVKTMNAKRRALGVTRGVPDFSLKFSAAIQEVNPEIDWHAWLRNKESRLVVLDLNGDGKRISFVDVFLNSISEKHDEGGESMYDIDAIALDRQEDN